MECGREAAAFSCKWTQEQKQETPHVTESENMKYEHLAQTKAAASRPHSKGTRATSRFFHSIFLCANFCELAPGAQNLIGKSVRDIPTLHHFERGSIDLFHR